MRQTMATPGYLARWAQDVVSSDTLPWKAIGGAALAVANSVLGVAVLPLFWAVLGLWFADMLFGMAASYKRKEHLTGQRAFDGLLKGCAIFGLVAVAHLVEIAVRTPSGTESEAGVAASVLLGVATVSLFLSIKPNAVVLWKDAGEALDRVGGAMGMGSDQTDDTPPAGSGTTEETDDG